MKARTTFVEVPDGFVLTTVSTGLDGPRVAVVRRVGDGATARGESYLSVQAAADRAVRMLADGGRS